MEKLGSLEHAQPLPSAGPVAGVSVANTAKAEGEEEAGVVSSKLFGCACMTRWIPLAYREELYHVVRLTGPLVSRGKLKCWWRGFGLFFSYNTNRRGYWSTLLQISC